MKAPLPAAPSAPGEHIFIGSDDLSADPATSARTPRDAVVLRNPIRRTGAELTLYDEGYLKVTSLAKGNADARVWVSAVKAMVPERVCQIIDQAIQLHGATGVSQWTPLARMYAGQRTLRLADGPDEVHWHVVGRAELARYESA